MMAPDEHQWGRVERLADELNGLPAEKVRFRLSELASSGESPTILTLLGAWLEIPPPFAGPILQPGMILAERYALQEKIGEGGMGAVWRASQELIDRHVALKIIHPALVTPTLQSRFAGEIKILGQLNHRGIVKIFDAGVHHSPEGLSIPFFAMELIEGEQLDTWAAAHRNDHDRLLRVAIALCAALGSAHERQIVHRDLKPSNIIVRPDGSPVVLDFGIARLAGAVVGDESGMFSGTPRYAAPEQHLGRDRDFRSGESVDVYAVGVMLFEMLSGQKLFSFRSGISLSEMRRAILEEPPRRLAEVWPEAPAELDALVARATRRDPADRFYSIAALGRAITRAAGAFSSATMVEPPWRPSVDALVPGTSWRLTNKIGAGGVGEVWSANHAELGEKRVFKFCDTEEKARTLKRELTLYRLLKERVGRNRHFIQLQEVSLDERPWYLMMEHVEASGLEEWCAAQPGGLASLSQETKLEILIQAADALQAAHEAGILHRDIKPSNLLVTGSIAGGDLHVYVADFGIGQVVAEDLLRAGTRLGFTQTVSGVRQAALAGTMLYLAPEVLEGTAATARSDIYSVGVVFWQLLIGNLKAALDPSEWALRISDPLLREDLNGCLAGNPEKRWASAGELAERLRKFAERQSAEARRNEELLLAERRAYWRGVLKTAGIATAVALSLGWLAWTAWQSSIEADKQRLAAARELTRTTLREMQALSDLKSSDSKKRLPNELRGLDIHDTGLESDFRAVAVAILALPGFDSLEWGILPVTAQSSFSIRGERLVTATGNDRQVCVLNLALEPPLTNVLEGAAGSLSHLRVNTVGRVAGGISDDGALQLWYGADLSKRRTIAGPVHAGRFSLAPSPLGRVRKTPVAVARPDGAVEVFLAEDEKKTPLRLLRRATQTEEGFPESCAATMLPFSLTVEGILAAAGPDSGNLLFWKIADQEKQPLEGSLAGAVWHPDVITCAEWNPAADEIATGSQDGFARLWRFETTGTRPQTEPLYATDLGEPIVGLTWSPDGNMLAVLLKTGRIEVLWVKGAIKSPVASLSSAATQIAFSTGNILVACNSQVARFWGGPQVFAERYVSAGQAHAVFQEHGAITVTGRDRIEFLNPVTLASTAGFRNDSVHSAFWQGSTLFFTSGGQWKCAAATAADGCLRIPPAPRTVPDMKLAVASDGQQRMAIFDGQMLRCKKGETEEGTGTRLRDIPLWLAVSDAAPVTAWKMATGGIVIRDHVTGTERLVESSENILSVAFGAEVAAFRTMTEVIFLNLRTGERATAPLRAPGNVSAPLAFAPGGQELVATAADHSLILARLPVVGPGETWPAAFQNIFTNAIPLRPPVARRAVSLDWNASGSRVVCGTADGFVQTWNVSLLRSQLRLMQLDQSHVSAGKEMPFWAVRLSN